MATDLSVLDEESMIALLSEFSDEPSVRINRVQMLRHWMMLNPSSQRMEKVYLKLLKDTVDADISLERINVATEENEAFKNLAPGIANLLKDLVKDPLRVSEPTGSKPVIDDKDLGDVEINENEMIQGDDTCEWDSVLNRAEPKE